MRHPVLTRIDELGNKLVGALSLPQNAGVVVGVFSASRAAEKSDLKVLVSWT